jgi:hypothetical protein
MKPKKQLYEQQITGEIIGAAIEVHRELGPGLLESSYEICLARELELRGISFEFQKPLPMEYKGVRLDCGYRRSEIRRYAGSNPRSAVADLPEVNRSQSRSADQFQSGSPKGRIEATGALTVLSALRASVVKHLQPVFTTKTRS